MSPNDTRVNYAYEKLSAAVRYLACGDPPLKERLVGAFMEFGVLRDQDFPEGELRDYWRNIHEKLNRVDPVGDEGSVKATVEKMNYDEAHHVATQIVELCSSVGREFWTSHERHG